MYRCQWPTLDDKKRTQDKIKGLLLADLSRPPLHDISLNPEAMKINRKAGTATPSEFRIVKFLIYPQRPSIATVFYLPA
jgi:hypothetical protein